MSRLYNEFVTVLPTRETPRRRSFALWLWEMSHVIAWLAAGIVVLALLVTAFAGTFRISDTLGAIVPKQVQEFFNRPSHVEPPRMPGRLKETAGKLAPPPGAARNETAAFTIGSSEDTVLKVQGRPTGVVGSTWFYGQSEIQFVAGRVVSWKDSSTHPLKVR